MINKAVIAEPVLYLDIKAPRSSSSCLETTLKFYTREPNVFRFQIATAILNYNFKTTPQLVHFKQVTMFKAWQLNG